MSEPFSLTEREIYRYVEHKEGAVAEKAFALVDEITKMARKKSPSVIFERMISLLQSWRWLNQWEGDSMDTLYYALELIRAEEATGKLRTAEELKIFIDQQLRHGVYEYEMATEERSRGIKLLNLHKSKGLEAPVVILADAELTKKKDVDFCKDFQSRTVYIGDISNKNEFGVKTSQIAATGQFSDKIALEEEQLRKEKIRLRYVAATRAENVLLIPELYENLGKDGNATIGDKKDGRWDSFLDASSTQLPYYIPTSKVSTATDDDSKDNSLPEILRVKELTDGFSQEKSYETLNPSKVQCLVENPLLITEETGDGDVQDCEPVKSSMEDGSDLDDAVVVKTPESWRAVPATVLGTAVHRLMQAMVDRRAQFVEETHWVSVAEAIIKEEDVEEQVRDASAQILGNVAKTMSHGGYPQVVEDNEAKACPWIPEIIPQDLMEEVRAAEEVYTELPFSLYLPAQDSMLQELAKSLAVDVDSDGFINGIMDLIYYKDGRWIICDYKTNYRREGLYGHYEGQLLLYREIAKKLLDLPELPQAYLYHIPCKVATE